MNKQAELIKQLSKRELIINLYLSQLIFVIIAILLSLFLFERVVDLLDLFSWDLLEILVFGFIPGLLIVLVDIILIKFLPEKHYDDGGINKRIFTTLTIPQIFILSIFVSFSEELLFRGVIQTSLGLIVASILFALVHFRYLNKVILLISVLLLSFLIGYMYLITNNLWVPIVAHFTIDFLLGIYYRLNRE